MAIREVEEAMGETEKKPSISEKCNIDVARKSIVALRPIKEGEVFCAENITTKRPGTGISPMMWKDVIGRSAKHNYNTDQLLMKDELI